MKIILNISMETINKDAKRMLDAIDRVLDKDKFIVSDTEYSSYTKLIDYCDPNFKPTLENEIINCFHVLIDMLEIFGHFNESKQFYYIKEDK